MASLIRGKWSMLEFCNLEASQPSVNFFSFSIFSQFRRREESLIQRRILTAVTRLKATRKRTNSERQSKPVTWCVVLKQLKKKNQEAFKLLWIRKRDNISSSIYKRIVKATPNTNSTAVILVAFFVHFFCFIHQINIDLTNILQNPSQPGTSPFSLFFSSSHLCSGLKNSRIGRALISRSPVRVSRASGQGTLFPKLIKN